jgi:hypothetical protein
MNWEKKNMEESNYVLALAQNFPERHKEPVRLGS